MVIKRVAEQVSDRSAPPPVVFNTPPAASTTGSHSTTQYTPSNTPFTFRFRNPDSPLPSIERDAASSSADSRSETPLSIYTPSISSHGGTLRQGSEYGSLDERLQNLKLLSVSLQHSVSSPQDNVSQAERPSASPTPSIHVTSTPSVMNSRLSTATEQIGGLINGVNELQMNGDHRRSLSAESSGRAIGQSADSPARRRRSTSAVNRTTHKVEDEEPPHALFHERRIQEALNDARSITRRLATVLSVANTPQEQASSIKSIYQEATKLSTFEPPSRRIVGLVGDSGVGKSSLINSLLDKVEFARASNSGAACTCVVTEYHFHDSNDYLIDIEYFTVQDLRTQFEQLLSAYRERKSTPAAEAGEDLRRKADLAKSTFRASFRSKLDNSPEVLEAVPLDQAINKMMEWVSEMLPALNTRDGYTRESFEDIDKCSSRLKTLTSEVEEREQTSLWPFIRTLKVYMRAHILSRGLILADLPGLRDLNYARQNVTERYVRQCDQIFAVARIGRATTDIGVKEVFELARRASLSNVGVICTQSDNIRASEAKDDWPHERTKIGRMEEHIAREQQKIASLDEDIFEFSDLLEPSAEDALELLELQQDRQTAIKVLDNLQYELKHHIITVRNRRVCSDLQKRYNTHPDLHIFCVSNTIYSEERDKPVQKALPLLKLSGILELRRYCIGIVAESHLQATTEYIKNEIPALLGSIDLWIQAGSANIDAERKQKILDAVSVVQNELDELTSPVSQICDITHQMISKFDGQLTQYMSQRARQWSACAQSASMSWNSFHHSSYAAFCRQYGTYTTRAVGYRCWNEEAIASMNSDMSAYWDQLDGNVASYLDKVHRDIDTLLTNVLKIIGDAANSDKSLRDRLNSFIATLRHRKNLLIRSIQTIIEDFHAKLSSTQTDALSPIRTSIIGQIMEADYNKANMEAGGGSDSRRKAIITSGFSSPSLFTTHRRRLGAQLMNISEKLQQEINSVVKEQVRLIENDLDTLRDENVVLESEKNPEFRSRLELEVAQAKEGMEKVRSAFNDF